MKAVAEIKPFNRFRIYFEFVEFILFFSFIIITVLSQNLSIREQVLILMLFLYLYSRITIWHELSHYFTARYFKYEAFIHYDFLKIKGSCSFTDYIKRNHFILIAVMPFIFIVCLFTLSYFINPYHIYLIPLFLIKLLGCRGDIRLLLKALKYDKNMYLYQAGNTIEHFIVFKEN